jgi:hypothetical protein
MVQIETLAADLSISDLLRNSYTIDLLAGSFLTRDAERASPGALYQKEKKEKEEKPAAEEKDAGQSLDEYFAKASDWKKYGEKAQDYLKKRKDNAEVMAKNEKPQPSKETAIADAERLGYLRAAADLTDNRPTWIIRKITIENVELGGDIQTQHFQGLEISSHPELNGAPSSFIIAPQGATEPTAKVVLRFDDPTADHTLHINMKNVSIGDSIKTGDRIKIEEGKADIKADGKFSAESLDIAFTLQVHDLKTDNETVNKLKQIEIPGKLYGSLTSPRIKVELSDTLQDAVVDAAKEKAKEEAQKAAEKEMNKALESDEAEELKGKASDAFKKFL